MSLVSGNFVAAAAPGCFVSSPSLPPPPWVLGSEPFDVDDFEDDAVLPDVATDPKSGVLTAVNTGSSEKVVIISTSHACTGAAGLALQPGSTRRDNCSLETCTTLVLVLPPLTLLHAVRLPRRSARSPDIRSDVQILERHPDPDAAVDQEHVFSFPLGGDSGPWQCSQGFGGAFTHFHAQTHHAVDFSCAVGTPVVSAARGTVLEVRCGHTAGGIAVSNLFTWNGCLVQLADGCCLEYVHLAAVHVSAGQHLQVGDVIGEAGDVGFAPVPHLHMQLLQNASPKAHTVPFAFRDVSGGSYIPVAGAWYDSSGLIDMPPPPVG